MCALSSSRRDSRDQVGRLGILKEDLSKELMELQDYSTMKSSEEQRKFHEAKERVRILWSDYQQLASQLVKEKYT